MRRITKPPSGLVLAAITVAAALAAAALPLAALASNAGPGA
jgi:hypothetical protein